jgi:hypothetical protein
MRSKLAQHYRDLAAIAHQEKNTKKELFYLKKYQEIK